MYSGLLLFNRW